MFGADAAAHREYIMNRSRAPDAATPPGERPGLAAPLVALDEEG